ncbi:hypothetical protein VA249_45220 (plasmid) [Vibrio alfacsensis]|uniref:DUF987 family protein n=1 Tax=Vibrio alfacsensis TaxID=1074311 RepID=UPI001BEF5179|nr:DUF987 family protein [Vibrio alfacsensis]BBM67876.1 hypothetical protein VA249_45220 [Vibrio alfacsensis]
MKEITIQKRSEAMRIALEHPTAKVMKYDNGKYTWHGSQTHYLGKQQQVTDCVLALWVERRTDRDGPYAQVMCLSAR